MKPVICFLAILGCCLGLPSSDVLKPVYSAVEPIRTSDASGPRIIGGDVVQPHSVPYQVAVITNNGLCGGSLISTTWVLTAAHCTYGAFFVELRLGVHYLDREEDTQVSLVSSSIINHEGYDVSTLENDVSLVLLPSSVTLNDAIQVVPLATSSAPDYDGSSAYLTGWGLTESSQLSPALRGVNLTVISNSACSGFFSVIRNSTLCTSGVGPAGACSSDSGGPLVVDGVQVGLVSFGSGSCLGESPTGFARVSSFREWIRTNAEV